MYVTFLGGTPRAWRPGLLVQEGQTAVNFQHINGIIIYQKSCCCFMLRYEAISILRDLFCLTVRLSFVKRGLNVTLVDMVNIGSA